MTPSIKMPLGRPSKSFFSKAWRGKDLISARKLYSDEIESWNCLSYD